MKYFKNTYVIVLPSLSKFSSGGYGAANAQFSGPPVITLDFLKFSASLNLAH